MKKNIVFIMAILSIVFLLTGCAPAPTAPPINTPPATCTIIVRSENANVWGQAVYLDGQSQPDSILTPWGSIQINNVPVRTQPYAISVLQGNTFSHSEYIVVQPGVNYVYFYNF
jgi:hypothetical protein